MLQKPAIIIFGIVLIFSTLACSFTINLPEAGDFELGPEQTADISIQVPDPDETTKLELAFGVGDMYLSAGGGSDLVDGTITYNVLEFEPEISKTGSEVKISQRDHVSITGVTNWDDVKNEWDLKLGEAPMELVIKAGAYDGDFDFGGLALESLTISDGASDVEMDFSEPNQAEMSVLRYETGASNVRIEGLGNANFNTFIFKSGAGDYTLDFSGEIQRDGAITLDSGLSNVILIIPEGVAAQVTVDSGLTNVNTGPGWEQKGTTYHQEGSGLKLTFVITMGAGNLTITR
ncbi:MAG: hypothetical protein JXA13_00045 [Anaerolineales bacterium]|nr:hypothetical protein [Anaerolineales bacterium]